MTTSRDNFVELGKRIINLDQVNYSELVVGEPTVWLKVTFTDREVWEPVENVDHSVQRILLPRAVREEHKLAL